VSPDLIALTPSGVRIGTVIGRETGIQEVSMLVDEVVTVKLIRPRNTATKRVFFADLIHAHFAAFSFFVETK
jgi:hypothetical protein